VGNILAVIVDISTEAEVSMLNSNRCCFFFRICAGKQEKVVINKVNDPGTLGRAENISWQIEGSGGLWAKCCYD